VYENNSQIPIGLIAMSVDDASDSAAVDVYHISAFKPGKGQGSEIMNYLCNAADEFEVRLCIQAEAQFSGRQTLSGADLVGWYRRFGFIGNSTMYREPGSLHVPHISFT
jgi:predicted GNAT family N-acyltransferase